MKGVLFSILLLFSNWVCGINPDADLNFLQKPPTSVYLNEVVRIPIKLIYYDLATRLQWTIPNGVSLERVSGICPYVPLTVAWMGTGICNMNIVIQGTRLGSIISGSVKFEFSGEFEGLSWKSNLESQSFSLQVIPHCPSMLNFPLQHATANQEFILNLKNYIKYYDENIKGKSPVEPVVSPAALDGLSYDPKQKALVGKPTRLGIYNFTVGAKNSRCIAQAVPVKIEVTANIKDKPVFKVNPTMTAGIPKQKYTMNLLELLQPKSNFMINNQVQFRIHPNMNNPTWLRLSPTDATKLEGITPESSAGKTEKITLIASTNTGGDSAPLTVSIPVSFDPSKQPTLIPFTLEYGVGYPVDFDVTSYVANPSNEPFELFIDKVEPLAPWLSHTKTALRGVIPLDVPGQLYKITLHTSTTIGGSSKPVTIPLQVTVDKEKTPYFNNSISLPEAYTGEPYSYDFQANHDVSPEDIPYQIELKRDHPTPGWIEIKNNQLIVKEVPDIQDPEVAIYVVIKNIPGGQSEVNKLYLKLFNSNVVKE